MNILILNDLFNENPEFLPKFLINFIAYYKKLKLRNLVYSLKKEYEGNVKIKIINAKKEELKINNSIEVKFFTDLRLNLDRIQYLKIKEKSIKKTKQNLLCLFKNLIALKTFNHEGIFIGNILEFKLERFFNKIFGRFKLIKNIFQEENYDRIILFNCNPNSMDLFQKLNKNQKNIDVCYDNFLMKSFYFLKWLNILIYLFLIYGSYLKEKLIRTSKINQYLDKYKKNKIIFISETKNQKDSITPVYNFFKNEINVNPIFYSFEHYVSLWNLTNLFRFILQKRNILIDNRQKISMNMKYNSIKLDNILKIFYNSYLFIPLIRLFNVRNNLTKFLDEPPKIVVIASDLVMVGKIAAKFFKLNNIPTLYIPHAAIPIIDDFVTKNDIKYFALGGQLDKDYYVSRGVPKENIEITGVPRYEHFYKGKIQELTEIKDKFDKNVYKFELNKFTIVLTTNAYDDFSNEKTIISVINALNELNLVDNFFIKLHPREDGKLHKKVIRSLNKNTVVVKDYNILRIIKSSDLLLSNKSTTILEAMMIGTPVIYLDFINEKFNETSKYQFLDENYIITVKNEQELLQKIKELVSNKDLVKKYCQDLKKYAKKFSFYDDKTPPTKKIVNLMMKLIKE